MVDAPVFDDPVQDRFIDPFLWIASGTSCQYERNAKVIRVIRDLQDFMDPASQYRKEQEVADDKYEVIKIHVFIDPGGGL